MKNLDTESNNQDKGYKSSEKYLISKWVKLHNQIFFTLFIMSNSILIYLGLIDLILVSVIIHFVLYFISLFYIGIFVEKKITSSRKESNKIHSDKVDVLNKWLADKKEMNEEFEALVQDAGFGMLHPIESIGPFFGKIGADNLCDWIEARDGLKGEIKRYTYVGVANFGKDGVLIIPDDKDVDGQFIVYCGGLYGHVFS